MGQATIALDELHPDESYFYTLALENGPHAPRGSVGTIDVEVSCRPPRDLRVISA